MSVGNNKFMNKHLGEIYSKGNGKGNTNAQVQVLR